MRILFTRFPLESANGGAERQTLAVMQGLQAAGHQVGFLGSCSVLLEQCAAAGIPCRPLHIGPPPVTKFGSISFFWRRSAMRAALIDALTHWQAEAGVFDVVIMLSLSEKLLLSDWCSDRRMRVFWWEHDRIGRWLRSNPWLPQLRALASHVTTITVSELSRSLLIALGWPMTKIVAIPNGVNPTRFGPNSAATKTIGSMVRVGCLARLSAEKGVDVLIQSVARLPQVELVIVGTGPEEGFLRKLAQSICDSEHQNIGRISIVPTVPDVGAFYRTLDVCVLPSRDNDPFGLVAAEAMQLGVATIVTDQCGIAGYIQAGTDALVVPADDSVALERALSDLLDSNQRQTLAKNGQAKALVKFAHEHMITAYIELLTSAKA
jgi:glycosyltransferase involved in cell wall biosynthesis